MKKTSKIIAFALAVMLLGCTVLLSGCKSEPLVIKDSETCIVIKTPKDAAKMPLIDYMKQLTQEGKMTSKISDGMITSINGIDNPADFSSCWMLYTSDAENANSAWGTVSYDGKEYGSAVSGAETLQIKPGQLYIWVFQSFG